MKLIRIVLLAVLLPLSMIAQEKELVITEGNVKMGKTNLWCFSATYNYNKTITVSTIENELGKAELKRTSRKKGFCIYRGVVWQDMSPTKGDYYYKVRGKKGKATVYIAASKGYDNFATSTSDPEMATKLTDFLRGLDGKFANEIAIQKKEAELKAIEKRNNELKKQEQKKLKELKSNENDLKSIENRNKKLDKEETRKNIELESLKEKRTAPAPVQ